MLCDDVCHVPHQPLLITSPPQASKLPITIQASGHHDFEDNDDDDDDEDDDNDDDDDEDDKDHYSCNSVNFQVRTCRFPDFA